MKKIIFIITPLSILSLFFSCTKQTETPFYETKWVLKKLSGKDIILKNGTTPFIIFIKITKNVSGNSPCNSFSGDFICDYKTGGATFDIESISSTYKWCGNNSTIETDFYNALRHADFAKVVDNQLLLSSLLSSNSNPFATLEAE